MDTREIETFVDEGFVAVRGAFPRDWAREARDIMWSQIGPDPHDRSTWTERVCWAYDTTGAPVFDKIVNAPRLVETYDALVGLGRWAPRREVGMFPIRFPEGDEDADSPPDDGWHIDASFAGPDGRYHVNLWSRERALLMLFLFSDVGEEDAPTRIRSGSHRDVPMLLESFGAQGTDVFSIGEQWDAVSQNRSEVLATGSAGDVFVCHPFLIHAAQKHRGHEARFLSQPALPLREPLVLDRDGDADGDYSPVEQAVRLGLGR
ncbi:phytanoyl-CoA dioxygenase family protein [Mycobacterium sp. NPDC050853]|uniref:phytanoyl-CoA dioxygenase family protein n=1 Tax=Mycobacterium sp. NPDC050853 TaxID=3155160 RepID=UPI0033EAD7CE